MIDNFDIAKTLLEQNGEITGDTAGNSMKPLFRSGKDKAVIIRAESKIKIGDVLLYKSSNADTLNLHRVVKITKNGPVLRGDSLFYNETNIARSNIIGILKGFYRNNKYYDCQKHFGYKIYVAYIIVSFPFRRCIRKLKSVIKNLLDR